MKEIKTIDVTPTWASMCRAIFIVIRDGNKEGQDAMYEELKRMAEAADNWNEYVKSDNVKEWYMHKFPEDELGKEINHKASFEELGNHLPLSQMYYHLGVCDSIVRERVMVEYASRKNLDYSEVYDKWLNFKQ